MERGRLQLALVLLIALAIRLPFLNQAFQLDEPNYLAGAEYVQKDPLHPSRASYVFIGQLVDMRGHPHPPLNVWLLGLILAAVGGIRETPFHIAYLAFTLLAAAAAYAIARRFTCRPAIAALLFVATPAFVVHGNAVEADVPFTALWLAAAAAFIRAVDRVSVRWLLAAAAFLGLAALTAYQAILLSPVLAFYAWQRKRRWLPAYAVALAPFAVVAAYQLYDLASNGELPAAVLYGHFQAGRLQSLHNKGRNALALTAHLGWVLFPALAAAAFAKRRRALWLAAGAAAVAGMFVDPHPLFWASFAAGVIVIAYCMWIERQDADGAFLRAWVLMFFAGALALFFAGAARYLLPIVPAVALLATRALEHRPNWLKAGLALQLGVSLALAWSHYQHSGAYRDFVRDMRPRIAGQPAWVNGLWGFQHYAIEAGARPLIRDQAVRPGEWILTSRLGYPVPVATPQGRIKVVEERAVAPELPLRLIALNARSAFSTITFGVRPFDITAAPADVLRLEKVEERRPTLAFLPMNAPEAGEQILGGLYDLEGGRWRWTSETATVELLRPAGPSRLEATVYIPEQAAARRVSLALNGAAVAERVFGGPGSYTIEASLPAGPAGVATVSITVDRTFSPPGDQRRLGVILNGIGFK